MNLTNFNFKDKRVLVTGAGKGIGRQIAITCYGQGAAVVALSRTQEDMSTLSQIYPDIQCVVCDLRDWTETQQVVTSLGVFDLLVNNAGVGNLQSFLDVTEDSFDKVYGVNVKAVINVSQVVCKAMISAGRTGSIVNISSQASMRALDAHSVYCGSKAALDMTSRVMAKELGSHKIRVNCVNPTVVMTEMGKSAWSEPKKASSMLDKIPLRRFAEIDDVVNAVLFLLSDQSSMINGVCLPLDGGFVGCS